MRACIIIREKPEDYLLSIWFIDSEMNPPAHKVVVTERFLKGLEPMLQLVPEKVAENKYHKYTQQQIGATTWEFIRVRQRENEIEKPAQ